MEGETILLLRGRADGERMPLKGGNLGDVDEHVVTRVVAEVRRFSNHQFGNPEMQTISDVFDRYQRSVAVPTLGSPVPKPGGIFIVEKSNKYLRTQ